MLQELNDLILQLQTELSDAQLMIGDGGVSIITCAIVYFLRQNIRLLLLLLYMYASVLSLLNSVH